MSRRSIGSAVVLICTAAFALTLAADFAFPFSTWIVIDRVEDIYSRHKSALHLMFGVVTLLSVVIAVLIVNIIRKNRAEVALRASEEKFRRLVETAHEGVLAVDENFGITFVNKHFADLLGYLPEEIVGRPVVDFVHPEEGSDHFRRVEDRRQKRSGHYERRFLKKGGEVVMTQVSAQPLFDENDRFCGALTMVVDVTQQKQMEEALREAQSLLITALDQSLAGIIIVDAPSGRIRIVNRAAEEILQEQREIQQRFSLATPNNRTYRCFHLDGEEYTLNELPLTQAVLHGKSVENIEMKIQRHDGSERWILESASPIRGTNGSIVAAFIVFSDVTLQRQYQSDLQRAAKLESVGLLAGGIAHDFNNLLSAIVGNAGALKILLAKGDISKSGYCLGEIENAAMRARDLTQQLLTFSKGGSPVLSLTALPPILREAATFALAGSHNRCEMKIPALWPVIADGGQISQVIHNLLLNADQAMPQGGSIHIHAENAMVSANDSIPLPEGPYVRVSVQDHGIGIPEEHLSRIFDPFFTTKQKGSGLGLASVYSIIAGHNGYICAHSKPGKGSSFTFYIPAKPGARLRNKKQNGDIKNLPSLHILVMDDEEIVRSMIEGALSTLGHSSCCVSNGKAALQAYQKSLNNGEHFDLMILDLTVPGGMGGKDVVRTLNASYSNIKAIAMSGYATDPVMAHYTEYGFLGRLTKPFRISELQDLLSSISENGHEFP